MLGAGAVGILATLLLRLAGGEVWTASLEPASDPRAALVGECGARYVSLGDTGWTRSVGRRAGSIS